MLTNSLQSYIAYEKVRMNERYQALAAARWALHQWEYAQPYSVLGVIELVTDNVMGAAEQCAIHGVVNNYAKVLHILKGIRPFMVDYITEWYLDDQRLSIELKEYLQAVDLFRLQLIEILELQDS